MTLFTAPVGYSVAYTPATATTFQGERKVNPHKDSVFIDPRTGELIALGAAVVTAALAFVFRGKIKNIPFVKNTVIPAVKNGWTAVKGFAGKAWTATKTYAGKAYNAVKNVATKAWDAVKNFFKKAPAAAGGAVPTP